MRPIRSVVGLILALCVVGAGIAQAQPPVYGYEIVNQYPHATDAFTQGLVYEGGKLYESTGLFGSSSLREVNLQTGAVIRKVDVPSQYFAEGMTIFQGKIFQLTWQSQVGFIYDPGTFAKIGEFSYTGEGWGLTHDAQNLIMSDGTNIIRFLHPTSFQVVRTIAVLDHLGSPVNNLNELEYINGEIYANIWQSDRIARINPTTGAIIAWIDLTGLRTSGDVLNGIAFDAATGHLLVTGKLWPWLYRINVVGTGAAPQMTTPPPGATLTGTTQVFEWTAGTGVSRYWLFVGSIPGGLDFFNQDRGTSLTATVTGLPSDGRTLYARLWWLRGGAWEFADFTYTAASGGGGGLNPQITDPVPGSTLASTTQVFQWSAGTGVSGYWLYVGSSQGGADLFNQDRGTSLSATVSGLPSDGRTIHARLWWLRAGAWGFADFTFTAMSGGGGGANPQITSPPPGATLSGTTQVFQWSAGTGATRYWLSVGSTQGGRDLFDQDLGSAFSASVSGMPSDGRTLYVRLWWVRAGSWEFADFMYRATGG